MGETRGLQILVGVLFRANEVRLRSKRLVRVSHTLHVHELGRVLAQLADVLVFGLNLFDY